jgi:hypothetical protein
VVGVPAVVVRVAVGSGSEPLRVSVASAVCSGVGSAVGSITAVGSAPRLQLASRSAQVSRIRSDSFLTGFFTSTQRG